MIRPRFAGQAAGPFRMAFPLIAGSGLIGGTLYYRSQHKAAAPDTTHNKAHASAKRDKEGLSGAGIGATAVTGGHETGQVGSGVSTGNASPDRAVNTEASKEKLPSGGVGGGVGGGGANVRAVEMSGQGNPTRPSEKETSFFNMSRAEGNPDSSSTASNGGSRGGSGKGESKSGTGSGDADALRSRAGDSPATALQQDASSSSGSSGSSNMSVSQRLQSAFGQGGATAGAPGENTKKYHDTRVESNRTDIPTKRPQMRSDS